MYSSTSKFVSVLILSFITVFSNAQQIPVADIQVSKTGKLSGKISISFSEFTMNPEVIEGNTYYSISLSGMQQLSIQGKPAFPVFHRLIEIPEGYELKIEKIDYTTKNYEGIIPVPYRKPAYRNSQKFYEDEPLTLDKTVYESKGIFPSAIVEIGDYQYLSGLRIANLLIYPFRFNSSENSLIAHFQINLEYSYVKLKSFESNREVYAENIQKLAQNMIIGFSDPERQYKEPKSPSMLIVVHDEFFDNILPFAEWKNRKGIDTRVVKVSEINASGQDDILRENIFTYIQQTEGVSAFDYLLLVGDISFIPAYYGVNEALNDHSYSTLNDGDFLPDIMVGRFPVNTPEECDIYVKKIINYEKNIQLQDSLNWLKRAVVAASSDKLDDKHGKHIVSLFNSLGFSKTDDLRQSQQKFTNYNLINAFNEGRGWMFYIGHGDEVSWLTTGTFSNNTINKNLTYTGSLPMIISVACLNAAFDYKYGSCFGENWLNAGVDKGAIGFIGATEMTPFFYSDTLGKHALIGYLKGEAQTIGEALVFGKLKMYESFPNNSTTSQTLETMQHFMLIGDPSLMPYTDLPTRVEADLPDQIQTGKSSIFISVKANGNYVRNALVSITSPDFSIKHSAYTDEFGNVSFTLDLKDTGQLIVVITGRNLLYFEKTIQIVPFNALSENPVNAGISVYPNPAIDYITISLKAANSVSSIEIINFQGEVVYHIKNNKDVQNFSIPVNQFPQGIYLIQVTESSGRIIQSKFIVVRP